MLRSELQSSKPIISPGECINTKTDLKKNIKKRSAKVKKKKKKKSSNAIWFWIINKHFGKEFCLGLLLPNLKE